MIDFDKEITTRRLDSKDSNKIILTSSSNLIVSNEEDSSVGDGAKDSKVRLFSSTCYIDLDICSFVEYIDRRIRRTTCRKLDPTTITIFCSSST